MSRPLDELHAVADPSGSGERRLARATARAFAAALSALLISTLVVSRSDAALEADGTTSASTASTGTIELVDDDGGRSLFDLRDIAPGRPFERCVEVSYEGSLLPVELTVLADAEGELATFLQTSIESGTGGSFASCDAFEPEVMVYEGTLASLAASGATEVATLYNTGDTRSFRIRFEVADTNDALGLTTTAGFIWEVRPS